MKLAIVVFVRGLDAGMIRPWLTMARTTYPGAEIVMAVDDIDPCETIGEKSVPSAWGRLGAVRAVPESLIAAATLTGADWVMKTDVDCAHLGSGWLDPCRTHRVVGLQAARHPWAFVGAGYVLDREMVFKMGVSCSCSMKGITEEDAAASLKTRHHAPNEIYLHKHAPMGDGIFATWNPRGCRDIEVYRSRFQVVHCGERSIPRDEVTSIMEQFAAKPTL
jgi:hypothetical protein